VSQNKTAERGRSAVRCNYAANHGSNSAHFNGRHELALAGWLTRWVWRATAVFAGAVGLQVGLTLLQRTDLATVLQSAYLVGALVYISMNGLLWSGAISAALAGKRLAWYLKLLGTMAVG